MAAVIIPSSLQQKVKNCITAIKKKMRIPINIPLHWYRHCRKHETRKFITGEIAKLEGVTVIYVISDKKTVPIDHISFYNLVAALTIERILKHAEKVNSKVNVWFGHVRGFNHTTTIDYFQKRNWRNIKINLLLDMPKWIPSENNSGLQLADQYAGILGAAMLMDEYSNFEPSYLENVKHQIRKSESNKISGYGIKAISVDNDPLSFKWWPNGWL